MSDRTNINEWFLTDEECLSAEQVRAYSEGKLSGAAQHAVERHLLTCDLCAAAFEGLESPDSLANMEEAVADITNRAWARVGEIERKKRRGSVFWLSSAAGLALLIVVGFFVLKNSQEKNLDEVFAQEFQKYPAEAELEKNKNRTRSSDANLSENDADQSIVTGNAETVSGLAKPANQPTDLKDLKLVEKAPPPPVEIIETEEILEEEIAVSEDAGSGWVDLEDMEWEEESDWGSGSFDDSNADEDGYMDFRDSPAKDQEKLASKETGTKSLSATGEKLKNASPDNSQPGTQTLAQNNRQAPARNDLSGGATYNFETETKPNSSGSIQQFSSTGINAEEKIVVADEIFNGTTANKKDNYLQTTDNLSKREKNEDKKGISLSRKSTAMAPQQESVELGATRNELQLSANELYKNALENYRAGNHTRAATEFDGVLAQEPDNVDAQFYAGVNDLAMGDPNSAILHLEAVLKSLNASASRKEDANWYKALALIKNKEKRQAERLLNEIIEQGGKYESQARKTLEKL